LKLINSANDMLLEREEILHDAAMLGKDVSDQLSAQFMLGSYMVSIFKVGDLFLPCVFSCFFRWSHSGNG